MSEEIKFYAVTHDDAGMAVADGILPETPAETGKTVTESGDEAKNTPAEIEIPGFSVSTKGEEPKETPAAIEIPGFSVSTKGEEPKETPAEIEIPGFSVSTKGEEPKETPAEIEIPGFRVSTNETEIKETVTETVIVSSAQEKEEILIEETYTAEIISEEVPQRKDTETADHEEKTPEDEENAGEQPERILKEEQPEDTSKEEPDEDELQEKGQQEKNQKGAEKGRYVPNYDTTDDREISGGFEGGIIPENPRQVIGVRFRSAGKVYYFSPGDLTIRRGSHVIVETARGLEYGTVVGNPLVVTKKQFNKPLKPVTRIATEADAVKQEENRLKEKEAYRVAREKIEKHGLEMKLVSAEYTFDGSKIMFYFTADGRIDFRDLVKDLASVFRTRIELRQIGVRDETKMLGGFGPCGRPLCCAAYLSDFVPVSIKMAKEQSLSLNPTKISGVCGRLMCCLKNEEDTYEDLNKNLPGIGDEVRGADGLVGEVEGVNVLRQTIRVMVDVDDEKEIHEYGVGDFEIVRKRRRGDRRHKAVEGQNGDKTAAGNGLRGGRKPLSTVAAAVAAKQREEEAERIRNEENGEETPGDNGTERTSRGEARRNRDENGDGENRRSRGERRGRDSHAASREPREIKETREEKEPRENRGEGRRGQNNQARGEGHRRGENKDADNRRSRVNSGDNRDNGRGSEQNAAKDAAKTSEKPVREQNREGLRNDAEHSDGDGARRHRSRRHGRGSGQGQNGAADSGSGRTAPQDGHGQQ